MSYHRESWMMEKDEKLQTVPFLHMQGNALVKQRQFREAASKYKEAVLLLKTVQSRVSEGLGKKDRMGGRCLGYWDMQLLLGSSGRLLFSCFALLPCVGQQGGRAGSKKEEGELSGAV